jgi:hypothetical protein
MLPETVPNVVRKYDPVPVRAIWFRSRSFHRRFGDETPVKLVVRAELSQGDLRTAIHQKVGKSPCVTYAGTVGGEKLKQSPTQYF